MKEINGGFECQDGESQFNLKKKEKALDFLKKGRSWFHSYEIIQSTTCDMGQRKGR
jgi:hypothetical protein